MFKRLVKSLLAVIAIAAVGALVFHFRLWERDWSTLDDGWGNVIGSAVGSFLAVVGALYVSKAEDRRKKKEFEEFVKVCVQNLVVQSSFLEAMAREPHKVAPTPELQHGIISIQLRSLTDILAIFDREIAQSRDGSYKLRQNIVALDTMLSESRHLLSMSSDLIQSLSSWHTGAYQIRYHATTFLDFFGWIPPIPSSDLIGQTIKHHIKTWRSWNIPVQPAASSHNVSPNHVGQPVHHAQA